MFWMQDGLLRKDSRIYNRDIQPFKAYTYNAVLSSVMCSYRNAYLLLITDIIFI